VSEFYAVSGNKPPSWCKKCNLHAINARSLKHKQMMIEYKGGKCIDCGEMPHTAAMAFHHLDPSKKDFTIAKIRNKASLTNTVKLELDKCVLLCANCHAIRHFKG